MFKKSFVLLIVVLFLLSCQSGKEDARNFSADFAGLTQNLKEKKSKVKTREEFTAFQDEEKKEFEALLEKYAKSPGIEEIEILRSKALLRLKKLDEAEQKIDKVLADDPDSVTEAKMTKVLILLERQKYGEACALFKEIEADVTDPDAKYKAIFYFALAHDDSKIKEEYSHKFLEGENIPEEQAKNTYLIYSGLASIATLDGNLDKAAEILKKGMEKTEDNRNKLALEKQLGQLDFIGKEAFPLDASMWVNSSPLNNLKDLQGKVVIIYFWAPWCPPCRVLLPNIVEEYNNNSDKGLEVIGLTKLTGKYSDDEIDKGKVSEEEEIELIKKYMERKKVVFPVVIAKDRVDIDKYKITGLPTVIIVNKTGNIDFIKTGSGSVQLIKDRIQSLLAE